MRGIKISIGAKLIGLTACLVAAIVTFLTAYFPVHEIAAIREEQLARVNAYGEIIANDVRSAVAFSDHETAREVLSSLEADGDVIATVCFDESGETLYSYGTPSEWVSRTQRGVAGRHVFSTGDRVAVVADVQSLEGPRGTIVIELTTAHISTRERSLTLTAVVVGISVLLIGVLAAWLIARSFTRRLKAIGDVASAVARGAPLQRMVRVDSKDEIGVLAESFNVMLARLQTEQERLRATVSDLRQAEDALAQTNRELESRVELRTSELRSANDQLHEQMEQRSKIELELRQAQKLESVGRLAAGVAHEINTPIQFVNDSCFFIKSAVEDVFAFIEGRRDTALAVERGEITLPEALSRSRALEETFELDYLKKELPDAAVRAQQGLGRVAEIVRALKEFAYADHKEQGSADLNRAITSTLTVAKNEYKYVADVHTELGELPDVTCYLGELNQVVLNVVINAAHAIEQVVRDTENKGTITIKTFQRGDAAVIEISDTGCGIPKENLDKVFDPFFTTKEIGKGSGQGLAIARSVIVDKHGGKLAVESTIGVGTTFVIELPINGNGMPVAAVGES